MATQLVSPISMQPAQIPAMPHIPKKPAVSPQPTDQIVHVVQEALFCGGRPLAPVEPLWRMAEELAKSTIVPKEFQGQAANCFLALVNGWEHDVPPLAALQNTMVVNNRAKFFGSLPLGLVRRSGLFDEKAFKEAWTGEGDTRMASCTVARVGCPPITRTFSIADARRARLWDRETYQKYPDRMLMARARGYALDDTFSDVLRGVAIPAETREEAQEFANEIAPQLPADDDARIAEALSQVTIDSSPGDTPPVLTQAELVPVPVAVVGPDPFGIPPDPMAPRGDDEAIGINTVLFNELKTLWLGVNASDPELAKAVKNEFGMSTREATAQITVGRAREAIARLKRQKKDVNDTV